MVPVCVCEREIVCVCERERERESVCVCARERQCVCTCMCVRERLCAYVCVGESVCVCMCERKRYRERKRDIEREPAATCARTPRYKGLTLFASEQRGNNLEDSKDSPSSNLVSAWFANPARVCFFTTRFDEMHNLKVKAGI